MSVTYPEASTKTSRARKIGREFGLPSSVVKLPVDRQPAEVIDSSQDEVGAIKRGRSSLISAACTVLLRCADWFRECCERTRIQAMRVMSMPEPAALSS
jgi:hypothetical protein